MTTIPESEMPVPRLELRWVGSDERLDNYYSCGCIYALVLRLAAHDIRRERRDEEGHHFDSPTATFELGFTRSSGTIERRYHANEDKIDTPFRDHSHAIWDSEQLGGLPVYAVVMGRAMLVEPVKPGGEST